MRNEHRFAHEHVLKELVRYGRVDEGFVDMRDHAKVALLQVKADLIERHEPDKLHEFFNAFLRDEVADLLFMRSASCDIETDEWHARAQHRDGADDIFETALDGDKAYIDEL